ncbi:L-rhamnose mutarotase [Pseudopedobacter beijingensis]|uniref:L-rhamnose mutarotase n=1 Tax=Pseudopedobacter beijingensis TaxID=1207056 RepID=A0ABW4I9T9_9SPHI
MQKIAFKMYLKPGYEEEYKKRHHEIWPELKQLLKESGISDYTIFFDKESNVLFAVQKIEGKNSQKLGENEVVKKWWAYMADIMGTNADNSPLSDPLKEVFHMD